MSEQFSLCWDNFHKNMSSGMQALLENEDLVDVTLAVEGRYLKAHKMVLSLCSPYFRELFRSSPCTHPIVFMKDVSYVALNDLLQFMYQGEVQVAQENLSAFIKTAESLQIKGLTGDGSNDFDELETSESEKPTVESSVKRTFESSPKPTPATKIKKPLGGPASKRAKYTIPAADTSSSPVPVSSASPTLILNKPDVATSASEIVHFKMEPENVAHMHSELLDESQGEAYVDDPALDDTQDDTDDYSVMETADDEPKAGTSADGAGDGQGFSKFIIRQSGTHDMVLHQHIYRVVKVLNGETYWSCANIKECPAKCITVPGKLLSKMGTHNHPIPKNFLADKEKKGLVVYKPIE